MSSSLTCNNMNHRRANSPVAYCPQCGGLVNPNVPRQPCSAEQHALSRRKRSVFCVECGVQLVVGPGQR